MSKTMIIAEIGVNHNGDIQLAKRLIDAACEVGADAVKFQCFIPEKLATPYAAQANYQKKHTIGSQSQLEMLQKLALGEQELRNLEAYCRVKGVTFLCSPFDLESIDILERMQMTCFKIPSGQITDYPYLKKIASISQTIILSTGMATLDEIEAALNLLTVKAKEIVLLHCTSEYPAPLEEVNLKSLLTLKEAFGLPVGYSDHTQGIWIPTAAVSMGACVIEKHFTLDRSMKGPDHGASIEPDEFKQMVQGIRQVEKALGDGKKMPMPRELENRSLVRKSIVATGPIHQGDILSEKNIGTKRPEGGINPMRWEEVIGQVANRDYMENEWIEL